MRELAAVMAVVAVSAAAGAPAAEATFPGRNGDLMASWLDASGRALYSVTGVSAFKPGTRAGRPAITCQWNTGPGIPLCQVLDGAASADGARVAVTVGDGESAHALTLSYRLVVVTPGGKQLQSLPLGGPAFEPAWSPDGDTVLVTRYDSTAYGRGEGEPRIVAIDLADGSEETLVTGGSDADWSATGRIAYVADGKIVVLGPTGSRRVVTTGSAPSWSPDGRRLAFERSERIWTARADGRDARRVSSIPATTPAWSPDGRRLAFVGRALGFYVRNGSLWVMHADGRCPRRLRPAWGGSGVSSPFWPARPGRPSAKRGRAACAPKR